MIKNYNKAAIITPGMEVSYSEMFANIDLFASHTPKDKGVRTIIFAENRAEWIYAFLAVWQNKGIAVPVDASLSVDDLAYIIGDCQPEAVWTSARLQDTVASAAKEAGADVKVLVMEDQDTAKVEAVDRWQGSDNFREMQDECAVIIYTSGTTGKPKGVMLSYRNLEANLNGVCKDVPIYSESRRSLILLPLHHILPLQGCLIIPILVGGGVAICPSMSGPDIMQTLQLGEVGIMIGVPRLWQTLYFGIMKKVEASAVTRGLFNLCKRVGSRGLSRFVFQSVHKKMGGHLDFCVSGGASLDREIAVGLKPLGLDVLEGYGMSETAPMISFTRPNDIVPGSVGKPLSVCETALAPDGEIIVKGDNVMMGYWNKPKETAETFDKEGWLHTGDLGRFDSEGRLYITGRSKELIILSNGKNVQPAEVEYKIEKYEEQVKEAAVIADGDQLAAIIVPADGWATDMTDAEAAEQLKRLVLEPYNAHAQGYKKVKNVYVYRGDLPRTKLDKLQRFKLKDLITPASPQTAPTVEETAAAAEETKQSEELRILIEYISAEKQMEVTGQMNLETDLGYDSLDFVGLQGFIEQTFGVSIAADQLPAFRTLLDLAGQLTATHTRRDVERLDWHTLLHKADAGDANLQLPRAGLVHRIYARTLKAFFKVYNGLSVKGVEHLPEHGPYILAPNHQSYMDGGIAIAGLAWGEIDHCYFYATEEHVQGKFLRRMAREHNVILMERRNLKNSILKLGEALKAGKSILIFPEGRRTHNGKVGDFKKTFAILAKELQVPIVPVRISGAYDAMPRGTHHIKPRHITVEYLKPVVAQATETYDELSERVRQMIIKGL